MYTITLTLKQVGSDLRVVAETSEPGLTSGVRVEEMLFLDSGTLPDEFSLTPQDLQRYGQAIGQAVIHGEILIAFSRIQARADADRQPLHVLLSVEVEHLRALRWERLCGFLDGKWKILRLQQSTPFSIYLPSKIDKRYPTISRVELKALVVVANLGPGDPYGLAEFMAGPVVESIRQALGKEIPCTVLASDAGELLAGADGLPTLDELCRWLTMERFPILHIVCHGKYDKGDDKRNSPAETFLFLRKSGVIDSVKREDHIQKISASELIARLEQLQGAKTLPHLTFLCSCETASPRAEQGLGGLGQRLVRELGMPAVVAMTEPVDLPLAQQLASEFYFRMRKDGSVDVALDEACAGIADRGDVLIPTLFSRLGGRKLFDEFGPLTTGEWETGIERLEPLITARAPAQLEKVKELGGRAKEALEIRKRTENRPTFDPDVAWTLEELQKRLQPDLNELCLDVFEQTFDSLARGLPLRVQSYDSRCPFPGLGVFDVVTNEQGQVEDFRPFFFGRKLLTEKVCTLLLDQKFLAVLGGSGTGKSSLVRAGVLEELRKDKPDLKVIVFPPGRDPVRRLQDELERTFAPDVLVVDQFEELFTLCTDSNARTAFLAELLPLRTQCLVVITMRTDFLTECAEHNGLHDLLNSASKHIELLQPLRGDELREVVERQRNAVGLQFEPELAERVFEDLEHEPGAMPLLQHCLRQLWSFRRGRKLCFVDYLDESRVGGVEGAIARTADDVYTKLSLSEQQLCPFIFERLVRIDTGATDQEVRRDTRQREELSQLTPEGGDADLTKTVVTRLADAKLLITTQNPLTKETEVEVAHEALIRHWAKLQNWLANARVTARLVERVRTDARHYYSSQANPDNLTLRGVVLVECEALLNTKPPRLTQDEASFIRSCRTKETAEKDRELKSAQEREQIAITRAEDARKAADKQRRLTKWAMGAAAAAGAGLVIAAVLFFYARHQRNTTVQALIEKGHAVDTLKAINRGQNSVFKAIDSKVGDNVLFQELAIDVYAKVTDTFEKEVQLRPDDDELRHETADMLIAFAWHLNDIGKPEEAITVYQRAESLLQTLEKSKPDDIEVALDRTFVMNNIGWALHTAGDREGALEQDERTLARRRELLKAHPTNTECRRQVGVSLTNLAGTYSDDNVQKALQYHQEAISIKESLWNENPRNRQMGLDLSLALSNLSNVHFEAGNLDLAINLKTRAFDLMKYLYESARAGEPSDDHLGAFNFQEKYGKYAIELAEYRLRRDGGINAVVQLIEEGLPVLKEMYEKSPTNQRYAFLYARALKTKARHLLAVDNLVTAKQLLIESIQVVDLPQSKVSELHQEYRAAKALLAGCCAKQGDLHEAIGHLSEVVRLEVRDEKGDPPSRQVLEDLGTVIAAAPIMTIHADPAIQSLLSELKSMPPAQTKWAFALLKSNLSTSLVPSQSSRLDEWTYV